MAEPELQLWTCSLKAQSHAWHCDAMGHMNSRHIMAMLDDATAVFFGTKISDPRAHKEAGLGWADRKHSIEFVGEINAGDLLEVRSRISRFGKTSLTVEHQLLNAVTGDVLALSEVVTVCIDLAARRSMTLPSQLGARA